MKTVNVICEQELQFLEKQKSQGPNTCYLLLHGYLQNAQYMMNKFASILPEDAHIFALNAPYPIVQKFPLSSVPNHEELIQGYAWYFFDPRKSSYVISMEPTLRIITEFIKKVILLKKPKELVVIGYSQGGYLLGELTNKVSEIQKVIAINASPKLLHSSCVNCEAIYINGEKDSIVDPTLAKSRFEEIDFKKGHKFIEVKDEGHKLSTGLISAAKKFF